MTDRLSMDTIRLSPPGRIGAAIGGICPAGRLCTRSAHGGRPDVLGERIALRDACDAIRSRIASDHLPAGLDRRSGGRGCAGAPQFAPRHRPDARRPLLLAGCFSEGRSFRKADVPASIDIAGTAGRLLRSRGLLVMSGCGTCAELLSALFVGRAGGPTQERRTARAPRCVAPGTGGFRAARAPGHDPGSAPPARPGRVCATA